MKKADPSALLEHLDDTKPLKKKSSGKPKRNKSAFDRALENVHDRFTKSREGDWSELEPSTLLGLYAYCHEKVYGVLPEELADDWYPAVSTVTKFMKKQEGLNFPAFIRWCWQRERRSRTKNPDSDFRIGWRYQFSQKMVTDYKVATGK